MPPSLRAFFKACASQFHPRMLALLILPLLVSLAIFFIVAVFAWDPLSNWVSVRMLDPATTIGRAYQWAAGWGLGAVKNVLMVTIVLLFFVPLAFVVALALTAAVAMPTVARFLGRGEYKDVAMEGSFSVFASLGNSVLTLVVFGVVYMASVPLWFVPIVGLVVPWLCWSWLTARIMRFDSLLEHAHPAERSVLIKQYRLQYFLLGLLLSALNFVPLMVLVTPVLSALAFGHFSLQALRDLRASGFKTPVRLS